MDVLKLIGFIAVLLAALIVYYAFESQCEEAFGEKLLTTSVAYRMAAVAWLGYLGLMWRQDLLQSGGDVLNGTLTVVCACVLAIGLVALNYSRLSILFGTIRTVLQLLLLPISMVLLILYPIWIALRRLGGPVPVRIVRDE